MNTTTHRKTCFFLIMAGLFLIQDQLQDWFVPFQYFDEAVGLLIVPMFFIRARQNRLHIGSSRRTLALYLCLLIFWLFGWLGHFVYRYQPLTNALKDSYVNIKFFLAFGGSFLFFDDHQLNFRQMKRKIWPILNAVTLLLFLLTVIDLFFGVFSTDTRGVFRAVKLFYSTQTVLVANCVFLSSIYLWYYDRHKTRIVLPMTLLCIIMFCTIRVKTMGAIAAILLIYIFVLRRKKLSRMSRAMKACLIGLLLFAGISILYQTVRYYYTMGTESARAMLTLAAPFVAWDHFPFGSGWGTFASAFSAEPYSPVYGMYRMAGIWGLSPSYPAFVSDTYWPTIIGECGYFGFIFFLIALILFVKKFLNLKTVSRTSYASALMVLLYLLISSTSESALANPMAIPLACWLGFLLAEQRYIRRQKQIRKRNAA